MTHVLDLIDGTFYIRYEQWLAAMDELARRYPEIIEVRDYGPSPMGLPFRAYVIGKGDLLHQHVGMVHGNELRHLTADVLSTRYWCEHPDELSERNLKITVSGFDPDIVAASGRSLGNGRPTLAQYMKWGMRDEDLEKQLAFAFQDVSESSDLTSSSHGTIHIEHAGALATIEDLRDGYDWERTWLASVVLGHGSHVHRGPFFVLGNTPYSRPEVLAESIYFAARERGMSPVSSDSEVGQGSYFFLMPTRDHLVEDGFPVNLLGESYFGALMHDHGRLLGVVLEGPMFRETAYDPALEGLTESQCVTKALEMTEAIRRHAELGLDALDCQPTRNRFIDAALAVEKKVRNALDPARFDNTVKLSAEDAFGVIRDHTFYLARRIGMIAQQLAYHGYDKSPAKLIFNEIDVIADELTRLGGLELVVKDYVELDMDIRMLTIAHAERLHAKWIEPRSQTASR